MCMISQNMHGAGSGDACLKCQPGEDKEEFLFILPQVQNSALSVTSFGALNKLLKFSVPPFPYLLDGQN